MKRLWILMELLLFTALLAQDATGDASPKEAPEEYWDVFPEGEGLTIIGIEEKTQQITVIQKEEIERSHFQTVTEVLQKAGGLNVKSYGGYGNASSIYIRGFSGGNVALLVDGVPVTSSQSDEFDLSRINTAEIERIEIVKGGSDTKYNVNGACGGLINIVMKKKHRPGWKIYGSLSNLSYYPGTYYYKRNPEKSISKWNDLFDGQNVDFGFGIGNEWVYWNAGGAFHRAANHFLYRDAAGKKRRRVDNEVYDGSGSTSLQFSFPHQIQLLFSDDFYYADKNIPGPMTSTVIGKQKDVYNKASLVVDADFVGTDLIDTELQLTHKFDQIAYREPGTDSLHRLHSFYAVNRWNFRPLSWYSMTVGGDFTYDYLDSTDCGKVNKFSGGGYVTAEFSLGTVARLVQSTKCIYYKEHPVVIPKLGVIFFLPAGFSLKSNFYRVFKEPSLNQLYWGETTYARGNPNLRCEDGFGGDLILQYEKMGVLRAESSMYANYYLDKIQWGSNALGQWTPSNVGQAVYFGSDHSLTTDFSDVFQAGIDYSFVLSYLLTGELTFRDDRRIMYTPLHNFGFHMNFSWKSGNIGLVGKFVSERYVSNLNISALDPFFTLDIHFQQNITSLLTLFCSVKNFCNVSYFETEDYPMPGGSITLGIKFYMEREFQREKNN